MWCPFVSQSFCGFKFSQTSSDLRLLSIRHQSSNIYGLQATSLLTSMDSKLPVIQHLWTPGYQSSDLYGLQATSHPTSMDSRLPVIRHLWTPGYQSSDHLFSSSFLLSIGLILISLYLILYDLNFNP